MPDDCPFMNGALPDTRTETERLRDFKFEEIVAAATPVNWIEKPPLTWRRFPIFNQDGSGSCVAQTLAKLLGVIYWLKNNTYVHFSATHIYQRRNNKPAGGMAGVDAFKIASEGVTLEDLVPSQGMSDVQMDNTNIPMYKKMVGEVFKIPNYVSLPIRDIDTIASVIQETGKAVMVWFYFQLNEWTNTPHILNPSLTVNGPGSNRHSVAAVDFTMYEGEKALVIEDSWGPGAGMGGQRIVKESFFKERNWFAAYPIAFVFEDQSQPKPHHTFNADLVFGATNADVKALQDVLRYEGLYPLNTASTGFYGAITATAIIKFRAKYGISSSTDLLGHRVGPLTRAKLNQLYS